MRVLLQRVLRAHVTVQGAQVGAMGPGLLLLVGVAHADLPETANLLALKTANLRIFDDMDGHMNRSALDRIRESSASVSMLVVSQFTLYADVRKGRRPSFTDAAPPAHAAPLVDRLCVALRELGFGVETGVFGAEMQVESVNDGPVTIWLDSDDLRTGR